MTKHDIITRPGMTAIAALVALSATPLMAQAADPLAPATESAPTVTSAPPVETTSEPTAAPVADPLSPAETTASQSADAPAAAPVARSSRNATRSATRTTARPVARPSAPVARTTAPAAAAPVAAAIPPVSSAPVMVPEPVVAESAIVAPPVAPAPGEAGLPDEALPIAGAGLGALILAAAAMALRRRRRMTAVEEVRYDEPAFAGALAATPLPERGEAPMMAWDAPVPAHTPVAAAMPVGDGEVPEGIDPSSHAAAAYRGPSADNPSLSLKKRLKRAAFFDQREKLAAAGMATPIARDAGLPDAMAEPLVPHADPVAVRPVKATTARPLTSGGAFSFTPNYQPA